MDTEAESVVADVQCYSVDRKGYYSELQEFNFTAPLDLESPLKKWIADNADPGLGFGDSSFDFKCYTSNFLGEHIDINQRPLQVQYIEDSIREQKNVVIYLCKEELQLSQCVTDKRSRSVVVTCKPSRMAHDFIKTTCGSVSGYESGYISDASVTTAASSSTVSFTDHQEDEQSRDRVFSMSPPRRPKLYRAAREITIYPSLPLRYQKGLKKTSSVNNISLIGSNGDSPTHSSGVSEAALLSTSLPSLVVPEQFRSKSPSVLLTTPSKPAQKRKVQTLDSRMRSLGQQKQFSSTNFDEVFNFFSGPTISSPVYRMPQPSQSVEEAKLHRSYAIKRRSLVDLGISQMASDLSTSPTLVKYHLDDHDLQGDDTRDKSPDEMLTVQITIFNYMTVAELKACICNEVKKQANITLLLPSSLVVYYSHDGEDYELLIEKQFMLHTHFHKLSAQANSPESAPILHAQRAKSLPEKELRVLYRISQLTGVLLEDSVSTQGVDTSSLSVLPDCDQEEVQNARRCLHSYMQEVVRERTEQEYCRCREITSREASLQLSLMTPTNNMIPVTFHYKTEFSLRRYLSIHTHADRALSGLFPCLVASGLVRDRIEEYTLQVSGEESFIYGEIELIAFRHVRKCILKSEPIHLSVTEKPPVEIERPHQFSWLSVDPLSTSSMEHHQLSDCAPICQEDVCSAWEMREKLRLTKLRIDGLLPPNKGSLVRVELKLLHGSTSLCSCVQTTNRVPARELAWSDGLEFDIEIRDIPKAARIMATLVESRSKQTNHGDGKSQLLFWGMLSVYEPSGRLRSGDSELRLWKAEENKKTRDTAVPPNFATHPSNNPYRNAIRLTVSFQQLKTVPIIYPSTKLESRTVLTRQHPAILNVQARRQFRTMLETIRKQKLYKALPEYIRMGLWNQLSGMLELFHALDELQDGIEDVPDHVALRMLDSDFPDQHVRAFAVRILTHIPDEQLEDYLLQLVQALKFEARHDSDLARFLLRKALTNKTIGHFFFWYLKSEMHNRLHMARFAVILEAYLKGCGEALLTKFTDQVDIQKSLCDMATRLRSECENGRDLEKMQNLLPYYLQELESPRFLFIPVHNPRNILGKLKPQKCKVMSSKKRPMWLEMYNIHPSALRQSPIRLILKMGDDLRQDMITLRMFSIFEKLWEEQGLDLELIPYGCIATGPQTGFIEVVKNAKTIKEVSSVTNSTKLFEWIKSHQKNEFGETDHEMLEAAVKRFVRSCAGYSVATYVLGIGDRHNDNIMVTTSGNLFHIDFGHFLGHIKYFMGFKREWAPFVLTPDFVYMMGGENSEMFETYKNLCCRAFLTLRRNADLIINLFSLMRSTGIPELTCVEDTNYIRNVLEIDLTSSEHVAEMRFRKVIQKCLNLKWTVQIMWSMHIAKNGSE